MPLRSMRQYVLAVITLWSVCSTSLNILRPSVSHGNHSPNHLYSCYLMVCYVINFTDASLTMHSHQRRSSFFILFPFFWWYSGRNERFVCLSYYLNLVTGSVLIFHLFKEGFVPFFFTIPQWLMSHLPPTLVNQLPKLLSTLVPHPGRHQLNPNKNMSTNIGVSIFFLEFTYLTLTINRWEQDSDYETFPVQ